MISPIPEKIIELFKNPPISNVDKIKRYDANMAILKEYILDLRSDIENLEGSLDNLKDAQKLFEAFRKIQEILNNTVKFPVPCGT